MSKIGFLTDSCSDIPQELADKYGIEVVGFPINLDGVEYMERKDFTNDQFYQMMRDAQGVPTTAAITQLQFCDIYAHYADEGYTDLVYLSINAGGSSTYNNAVKAMELLEEERPGYTMKIQVIDSHTYSMPYGWYFCECARKVRNGGELASCVAELKKKLDKFLYAHGAPVQVREGYGTTETVTACCLTPPHMFKEGSIGLPFPDTYIKIVEPDTDREVPYGQEGEILLAGPTVMKEYMNNPEETAQTLRTHADGLTWVYTGDLGVMDEQGFIYFRGRAKRMIISSGYNVYPGQIENILDAHEYVQMSCVIGVPDPYKMQKVKAFVKLAAGVPATEDTRQALLAYCRKNVAKYAMPYDIEFKEDMPKTLVGKVAYRQLEEEELAKIKAQEE